MEKKKHEKQREGRRKDMNKKTTDNSSLTRPGWPLPEPSLRLEDGLPSRPGCVNERFL